MTSSPSESFIAAFRSNKATHVHDREIGQRCIAEGYDVEGWANIIEDDGGGVPMCGWHYIRFLNGRQDSVAAYVASHTTDMRDRCRIALKQIADDERATAVA